MLLAVTRNLAKTKSLFQAGNMFSMTWHELVLYFESLHNTNVSENKDTLGFTIGEYKKYTFNGWRMKVYEKYLKSEESYSVKNDEKYLKMWRMINSEEKRIKVINSLFLDGCDFSTGFHRVSRDLINRQSIIIDFDNKLNNDIKLINHNEILEIINVLNCNYILYSSYNNSQTQEKFRVILPTDRAYTDSENVIIRESICNIFTVRNYQDIIYDLIDFTSFEPSRFFYVPVNKYENTEKYFYSEQNKSFISVEKLLDFHKDQTYLGKIKNWNYLKTARKKLC